MSSRLATGSTFSSDFRPQTAVLRRRECHFSGRVQGVGFRYTVKNIALRHDISGYIRNLPDGRVELVMEGTDDEMECVMQTITSRMNGYIRNISANILPATGEFAQFYIKH